MRSLVLALGALFALSACREVPDKLTIGHKSFAEQAIFGHLLEQVSEAASYQVELRDCGDTDGCQVALQSGQIDLMVEYTGTGALYKKQGNPMAIDLESLRTNYAPDGVEWLDPLGFDNGYRVVMNEEQALRLGIRRIEDLARLTRAEVRVACPREYLQRPGDGLAALLRRHGLRLRGEPRVLESPDERARALRHYEVDVAILYGTSAALRSRELHVLEDSLGFYPRYDAVIIGRRDALAKPSLRNALDALAGQFDNALVRELVESVEERGATPAQVAARVLRTQKLLTPAAGKTQATSPVLLLAEPDESDVFTSAAIRSVRSVFPDRPAQLERMARAGEGLAQGKARLAVLGAEAFFDTGGVRDNRLEAIAVLGMRYMHLVRRRDDVESALSGVIAIPPADAGGNRVARTLLPSALKSRLFPMDLRTALAAVQGGRMNAALIYAPLGDPLLAEALASDLRLLAFPSEGLAVRTPFLQEVRIPAGSYPGQQRAISTAAGQVVLAGRAQSGVAPSEVAALATATGVHEQPHPTLPAASRVEAAVAKTNPPWDWLSMLLNLLAIVFLLFAGSLMWRPGLGRSLS